jgi:hypothetical protein
MSAVVVPPPSPVPRRIRPARWVDARLITGVLLVVASVGLGAHVVSHAEDSAAAVMFTRELAAGVTISSADVAVVRVRLAQSQAAVYLTRPDVAIGKQLARPVVRGELATRSRIRVAAASTTVVVPLPSGSAPAVHRGQRIAVWSATKGCELSLLISDATVQAVEEDHDSFSAAQGRAQQVVLALDDATAQQVLRTLAQEDVVLRAGILSGDRPAGARPPSSAPSCATRSG